MRARLVAGSICALAVGALVAARDLVAQGLMVTGYADFEVLVENPTGDGNGNFYFDNHHFNLVMVGDIVEDLFAAVEVEYEHAGEEINLEYGYFGYTGFKNVRIIVGKFIVPFGRFNKDLHPSFINRVAADRPHGLVDILPGTYSDAGLWVSGAQPLSAEGIRFVYDAWAVNGLMGPDGGGIRDMRGNDREERTGDRDDNKAVGARAGFEFGPQGLDFGVSIYNGAYSDDAAVTGLNLTLLGADAAYRVGDLEVRGEIVRASQDATGGDLTKTGGYGQVSYFVTPSFEPVIRYSARRFSGGAFSGDDANDENRVSFGSSYYLSAASSIRIAYHVNTEATGFDSDNNVLALQWNIIF